MKAYILKKKNQPEHSHEHYIILATDKRELNKIVRNNPAIGDIRNYEVEEKSQPGLVYTDIY